MTRLWSKTIGRLPAGRLVGLKKGDGQMDPRKKILLIDDEEDFCFFVKSNLFDTGEFDVAYATDPGKGLKLAKKDPPDLILLDILMPKKNGFRVLEQLKNDSQTLYIPVIMLTAVGEDEAKIRASQSYCEDYLTKPVTVEALRAKINEIFKVRGLKA
jgi:DNA-binding response OmpR family regulator